MSIGLTKKLNEVLTELGFTPEICFLLGYSVAYCSEYLNDFSSLLATILHVNNLTRACAITLEERHELLLMLYKGSGYDKVNFHSHE